MLFGWLNQSESRGTHAAQIGEKIIPFRILVIKFEEKNLLERQRCMEKMILQYSVY
jgi:hypothetical protein